MSIVKQGASYGVIGLVQVGVDWLSFVALTQLGIPTGPANVTGRIVGALLGFWLNGRFTFAGVERLRLTPRHFAKFAASWALTTAASTAIVMGAAHLEGLHAAWLVKPIGDIALAAFGFAVSKFWIYR